MNVVPAGQQHGEFLLKKAQANMPDDGRSADPVAFKPEAVPQEPSGEAVFIWPRSMPLIDPEHQLSGRIKAVKNSEAPFGYYPYLTLDNGVYYPLGPNAKKAIIAPRGVSPFERPVDDKDKEVIAAISKVAANLKGTDGYRQY